MPRSPLLIALLWALPALALDPQADYARSLKWQYSNEVALPAPVTIARDTATWTLDSGTVRLMEPLSDGTVTGVVFEGQGRFTMTIPDRFELAQLRRFAGKRELAKIEQPFTQLVLRTSDRGVMSLFPMASGPYAPLPLAEKRHEVWLQYLRRDTDAVVLAALLNPGMSELAIDVKTPDFDWLLYEYDSWRAEEITLTRLRSNLREVWISLDRPEDRRPDGRPGGANDPASLLHVDVKADLTRRGRTGEVGQHNQRTIDGHYVVEATFAAARPIGALRLDLAPTAREVAVTDAQGNPLPFFRDHIGKRFADVDNELYDDDLTVILPSPLKAGDKTTVRFAYTWESANYAPGGSWYPMIADTMLRPHTARLELTVNKKNEARSMGRMENRTENEKTETTVWVIDKPAKMVTFSTATRFEEVKLDPKGIPPVIAFGPDYQLDNRDKVRNVGADVANSMQFFQILLGEPIDKTPQFYVTSIASSHGQAFDGFLHMGEFTFASDHPGASELFRAHEVAHEWFGHKIGWASYRDQWLSEAFAEYAAMMFVQGFVKNGDKYFEEILNSYDGIIKGQPFAGGFSKFARPWLARMNLNAAERGRVGPIAHGYRANTSEIPAYLIQAYHKGPMVLHMLRSVLGYRTRSDELFVKILRDYVQSTKGRDATTEDFVRAVERNAGPGWQPFFDSWVYGAEIPSYTWSYKVTPAGEGFNLDVKVKRSGVSPDFMTLIPIEVKFEDGKTGHVFVVNRKDEESATFKLPSKPKSVVFGPDYSVLAQIRRE